MAYCRFSNSDTYIYEDISHGLICCACSLMPGRAFDSEIFGEYERFFINDNFIAGYDYDKMLAHIAEHRALDEYIPEYVDEDLIKDRDEKAS